MQPLISICNISQKITLLQYKKNCIKYVYGIENKALSNVTHSSMFAQEILKINPSVRSNIKT